MDGAAEAILERWRALFAGDVSEMKHEEIEVYLSGYVDGELTEREMQRLGIHVETCLACNTFVEDLRQVMARVSQLRISLSKKEWERMERHIQERILC